MSRTIRCKKYRWEENSSWDRSHQNTNGYLTITKFDTFSMKREVEPAPSKRQLRQNLLDIHGESSSSNARSPGKAFRTYSYKRLRVLVRSLLSKNEDPIIGDRRSCQWEWS